MTHLIKLLSSDWIRYDHIFSHEQCSSMGTFGNKGSYEDIEMCKQDCMNNEGCNAFHSVDSKNQGRGGGGHSVGGGGEEEVVMKRQGLQCFFYNCPKPIQHPGIFRAGHYAWVNIPNYKGISLTIDEY